MGGGGGGVFDRKHAIEKKIYVVQGPQSTFESGRGGGGGRF